jgi:hypothetical protein
MSTLSVGALYGGVTLLVLFAGVPIAFALGAVAVAFMLVFMPLSALGIVAQNVYQEIANIFSPSRCSSSKVRRSDGRGRAPTSTTRCMSG